MSARITIIHPAIGHKLGEKYIRSWQMQPLPAAAIAGLTPKHIDIRFYDDRMELIPFDEPTDAVVMSVETYTARRVYQIASEFRKRHVPVILGGFHATLLPEEVALYAEAVVVGEAEGIWSQVVDDLLHGTLAKFYKNTQQPDLKSINVNRSIFTGKNYLPIGLVETGRGCRFPCDFCAIQTFFNRTHRSRPIDQVLQELHPMKQHTKLFFFVDDNFAGNLKRAGEFLRALAPIKIKWVTQMSINAAHDEEFLSLLAKSGCKGVLIGFESLNDDNLKAMRKGFNSMKGGYVKALSNLRRHNIRVYGTFVFGYDKDNSVSFDEAVSFAIQQKLYIAAFNHLTPFPGTPLYHTLEQQGRLRYTAWWLDETYRYNDVPFLPSQLEPQEMTRLCVEARRKFYSLSSIIRRGVDKTNRSDSFMFRNFFPINLIHRTEVSKRNGYPLGDETWNGILLEAN